MEAIELNKNEQKFNELKRKLLTYQLIMETFNNMQFNSTEQSAIIAAQKQTQMATFISEDFVDFEAVNLTYTERKTINNEIITSIQQKLRKYQDLQIMKHIEESNKLEAEIIQLNKKKRENYQKIITLQAEICEHLNKAAEAKTTNRTKELQLLHAKANANQVKSLTLSNIIINSFLKLTEHTPTAVRKAETYLNEALEAE